MNANQLTIVKEYEFDKPPLIYKRKNVLTKLNFHTPIDLV